MLGMRTTLPDLNGLGQDGLKAIILASKNNIGKVLVPSDLLRRISLLATAPDKCKSIVETACLVPIAGKPMRSLREKNDEHWHEREDIARRG